MTEPTDKGDTRSEDGPELPTDIEEAFRRWDARRPGKPDEPIDLLGDYPLTEDELSLDHEIAQTPEQVLDRARRAARYRLLFTVVLAAVAAITLFLSRSDLAYYGLSEDDIVDIGDLRTRWKKGDREFPEMAHNTWTTFRGGIMTEEREGRASTFYFYEPMTRTIVVTPRALPEKIAGIQAIHGAFADLHSGRWILPSDMSVGFSGKGRLLRASEAPRRYRQVVKVYRDLLKLDDRLGADATLWIFLDEASPSDQVVYLVIFGIVILVLMLSAAFYLRARRRVSEIQDAISAGIPL